MSRRADHVPLRTEGSGTRYDGRVWYELVTSIKTVNGVAVVDMETPLDKASLKHGDKVTLEFEGKCYSGEIDLEHSSPPESPRKKQQVSPKSLSDSGTCSVEDPSTHPEEVHSATRKRKHPPTAASFSEQKLQRKFVEKSRCICERPR